MDDTSTKLFQDFGSPDKKKKIVRKTRKVKVKKKAAQEESEGSSILAEEV